MFHLDPRTNQCKVEVQMIIYLQNLANQLPDVFIDAKKVTKSHILIANALERIDVLEGELTNEFKTHLKRGRPIGSKDITLRKRGTQRRIDTPEEVHNKQKALVETYDKQKAFKEVYDEQEAPTETYRP